MKKSRIFMWAGAGVLLLGAISAIAVASRRPQKTTNTDDVPLAQVKRGEIDLKVHATGALKASHSMMLTAPPIGGDALQITTLVLTGTAVKKGDTVIEFDPGEQHYKLEQSHSELMQAEQEITKAKADAQVQAAEDKVALLKARYGVRKAELDVQKNELVSKIDADKNNLALDQAKHVLAETEKDAESHKDSGQAAIYLAQEKYNKAKLSMDEAQQNLEKMKVTAPMDGLVSIQKNTNASGGMFFQGMPLPDYHSGDKAQPGTAIAEVVDPMGMELNASVPENNRSNIAKGEAVEVIFDALPEKFFRGTVKNVGGMSSGSIFFSSDSGGHFDVSIQLSDADPRLRAGLTAKILFLGESKKNVLYVPRQALFMKDGKRVVYISKGMGYDQREVKVVAENESRAAIDGLPEGTTIALIDPTAPRKAAGGSAGGSLEGAP